MPEENGNGKTGSRSACWSKVKAGIKEDVQSLKTDLPAKAKEQIEGLKDPTKTQVYTSIFRHKHDDTPRNRALGVLSNVFLHLHPAKINRDAVRYSYTWGMGGITFYLFIVLTLTGVMLMFYYHPSKVQAFRDVLYLEHDVPFGKLLRNMHRWAAHLMVIAVWLHMFRVFLTGSYKSRASSTGTSACCCWCSRCCSRSPATCFPTINSASGRSPWERTWHAPRRAWGMKVRSATCWG